jgi:hypothetical protein
VVSSPETKVRVTDAINEAVTTRLAFPHEIYSAGMRASGQCGVHHHLVNGVPAAAPVSCRVASLYQS